MKKVKTCDQRIVEVEKITQEVDNEIVRTGLVTKLAVKMVNRDYAKCVKRDIKKVIVCEDVSRRWSIAINVFSDMERIKVSFIRNNLKLSGEEAKTFYKDLHAKRPQLKSRNWNNVRKVNQYLEKTVNISKGTTVIASLIAEIDYLLTIL